LFLFPKEMKGWPFNKIKSILDYYSEKRVKKKSEYFLALTCSSQQVKLVKDQ